MAVLGFAQAQTDSIPQYKPINYAVPSQYIIGGVTVSGTKFLDPDILVSLSGLVIGSKMTIPGDDVANALRKLWDQGLFTDVQVRLVRIVGSTAFLDIYVKERARLSRFTLRGIKKADADDLREQIRLTKGRVVTENTKNTTANIIKKFYNEKGFLNANVTITEIPDTLLVNSVILDIQIAKGKKVKIKRVNIIGNDQVTEFQLKNKLANTKEKVHVDFPAIFSRKRIQEFRPDSADWAYPLRNLAPSRVVEYLADKMKLNPFSGSKFQRKDYEADKGALIDHYNSLGYRDAEIIGDSVYMDGNDLMIDIRVDEGNRYYFRNITWNGNTKYTNEQLQKVLDINKGDVYNQTRLNEKLNMSPNGSDVASLYMDDGHLFFQVQPLEVAVVGDSIDLEIRVMEGPIATINEVRIYGNTKTKEYVIRRELRTLPGSKFSRQDLIRSQREILALNYFDPEQMEVIPVPNPENGTVDIEYHVVEKPSDQLELSAGWGGAGQGVVGTLGVSFTNFSLQNFFKRGAWSPLPSGDGQKLSLRVQANGKQYQSYNASFTEPWLGGKKPNSFTVSWYMSRFASLDSERKVVGSLTTNGASIGIGTRLKWPDNFFTFQTLFNFQNYVLDNWTSSDFIITDGPSNNMSVKFVLGRYSAGNNPYYPTYGSNVSLSLQLTPPYSLFNNKDYTALSVNEKYKWVEYHKWRFTAEWFASLTRNKNPLVLHFEAKFGFMGYYNKDIGYSPFERFELGGDGISNIQFFGRDIIALRGYDVLTPSDGAPGFDKFTLELRFPISLNPSATIYTHAFAQAGNYWSDLKDISPFQMKRSAGVGVRIFLPMFGLLGFDYGIGFDKDLEPAKGFGDLLGRYGRFSIVLGFEPQ